MKKLKLISTKDPTVTGLTFNETCNNQYIDKADFDQNDYINKKLKVHLDSI